MVPALLSGVRRIYRCPRDRGLPPLPLFMSALTQEYRELDKFIENTKCVCVLHSQDLSLVRERGDDDTAKLRNMEPRFIVRDAGESGLGMFAQHSYSTGDLIWEERPVVIIPEELVPNVWQSVSRRLDPNERMPIMELRNAHPADVDVIEGILRTNFIGIEIAATASISYRGLFPIISRANHSCCSNATYYFNVETMALELRAGRRILPGEEIHVQYIDVLLPRRDRFSLLRELYFFRCMCPSCALPDGSNEQLMSDNNRHRICTWFDEHLTLEEWVTDITIPDTALVNDSLELLNLLEAEGLHNMQRFPLDTLCACYAALGDADALRRWAVTAKASSRMCGDTHPMVLYYNNVLSNLTSVALWNIRKTM